MRSCKNIMAKMLLPICTAAHIIIFCWCWPTTAAYQNICEACDSRPLADWAKIVSVDDVFTAA